MRFSSIAAAAICVVGILGSVRCASAAETQQVSGPVVYQNLAVYFIHGASAKGPVPLTLDEALSNGNVKVAETGEVNELKIENTGGEPVFIQSGDIVKGGRQDRTLTTSLILPPHSGEISIASFCVEHGRWSQRGTEDAATFASAAEAIPSREIKLAMKAPLAARATQPAGYDVDGTSTSSEGEVYERQKHVWDSVAKTQSKLSGSLATNVASEQFLVETFGFRARRWRRPGRSQRLLVLVFCQIGHVFPKSRRQVDLMILFIDENLPDLFGQGVFTQSLTLADALSIIQNCFIFVFKIKAQHGPGVV